MARSGSRRRLCSPSSRISTPAPSVSREARRRRAVGADDGRRHARQQQGFVSDIARVVAGRIDDERGGAPVPPAMAARQKKGSLAPFQQDRAERQRRRGLAVPAQRHPANRDGRNIRARARVGRAARAPPRHKAPRGEREPSRPGRRALPKNQARACSRSALSSTFAGHMGQIGFDGRHDFQRGAAHSPHRLRSGSAHFAHSRGL